MRVATAEEPRLQLEDRVEMVPSRERRKATAVVVTGGWTGREKGPVKSC